MSLLVDQNEAPVEGNSLPARASGKTTRGLHPSELDSEFRVPRQFRVPCERDFTGIACAPAALEELRGGRDGRTRKLKRADGERRSAEHIEEARRADQERSTNDPQRLACGTEVVRQSLHVSSRTSLLTQSALEWLAPPRSPRVPPA